MMVAASLLSLGIAGCLPGSPFEANGPTPSGAVTLDPSFFPSSDLRVVATPIGGNGRAGSDRLVVPPGHSIDFTIGAVARESRAIVH